MKIFLNNTENRIIELLKESPKAFTELKEAGGEDLQSDATLSRNLNRLQGKKLIEKFDPIEKIPHIRFRYRLTENYHDKSEVDLKKKRLQSWISSKMESQSIFNFLKHFLEVEYSILTHSIDFNEILLDIYSYIKYFNLNLKKIVHNPKYYIYGILYLILNHPDQKYKDLQKETQLNPFEFQDLLAEFKSNKALEEFQFKSSSEKDLKFYLISEDPILHNFREEIETSFQRFLICWEFPNIKFEENFDFLLHFSHYILDNEFNNVDSNKQDLIQFFTENKICLLIFIREYLWEFLEKLKLDSELEPPFKLLNYEEKSNIRSKILLSSQILPSSEKKSIEDYFYNPGIEKDKKIGLLKKILRKLAILINENKDIENKYELERLVYLKSHLLLLLKIFQRIDKKLYDNFRKSEKTLKEFNRIKLSYSYFSDEIFNNILDLEIGLGDKFDYEKRSFTIRFLFERIDHLVNQLSLSQMDKSIVNEKIQEIYHITSEYFSENIQKLFLTRKIVIHSQNPEIFPNSEIDELKNQLTKNKTKTQEINEETYPFKGVFPRKFEDIKFEDWGQGSNKYKGNSLKMIERLDTVFYQIDAYSNLKNLEELALLLLKHYRIDWTLRYLNIFLNYLKWFIGRKDSIYIPEINIAIDRGTYIQIIDFIGNCIRLAVYWEYRERSNAKIYLQKANKIYMDLFDKHQTLFESGLLKFYKEKLKGLEKKLS